MGESTPKTEARTSAAAKPVTGCRKSGDNVTNFETPRIEARNSWNTCRKHGAKYAIYSTRLIFHYIIARFVALLPQITPPQRQVAPPQRRTSPPQRQVGLPQRRTGPPNRRTGPRQRQVGPPNRPSPPQRRKPLHDDYQFRGHNDRKSSNITNANSSRRRKRPSTTTEPIAAASRQSPRRPQAHLETSSRPPLSMAARSPSRHPRALHRNDPTRPTMTDSATPPSSVTYESGTESGADAAQT